MFGNTKERSFTGLIVGFERFLRMNMDDDECIGQNLDHGVYTVMTQDCKHVEMTLQCDWVNSMNLDMGSTDAMEA